jgi:hypothetical protein
MKMQKLYLFFAFILFANEVVSQRANKYSIDGAIILGTENTPFWMRANKFGKVPKKGETISLFGSVESDYQNPKNKIDYGYGLNIGAFLGLQNRVIIQQAYAKAKWKIFEIYGGRREEIQGLTDTTLSSGSYIWSGNSLPMPKIDLSIPKYTSIGKSGIFSIKGNYAHGWFDRKRSDSKGLMLHQKSFYFRLGKPNYKLKFYGGFNHQAQYGGVIQFNDEYGGLVKGNKFGSTLRDYGFIITGRSTIGTDTSLIVGGNDKANRVGNHLGTMDFALEINLPKSKLFVYRQSIFEDGSLYYLNNITDGLHGISIDFKNLAFSTIKVKKINFEYLNTFSQGGPYYDNNPLAKNLRGSDNYFNNSQFRDGWSYNKTSIGSPFMLTNAEFRNPKYSPGGFFTNNRIQAFSISGIGDLKDIHVLSRISHSKNWGNLNRNFIEALPQTSFLIGLSKNFKSFFGYDNINVYTNLAGDIGQVLSKNIALQIGFRKNLNTVPSLPFYHPSHKH